MNKQRGVLLKLTKSTQTYHVLFQFMNDSSNATPLMTRAIMMIITGLSYLLLLVTLPISYWWCVVTLSEHDRMVVFRLGRMEGVKGPGKVITFPWMDECKKVDVRASAFSVPPQQFITQDGGIMEMGCEVQFEITDVETMVREVVDHQDILRSLAKTLMTKTLTKKTVQALSKDKVSWQLGLEIFSLKHVVCRD